MGDHFSQDLLINIFSRLGVKQLCQLKCLSKEWLHTISSPHFKKQHRDQSKRRPTLCLIKSSRSNYSQTIHISSINSSNNELQVHEYETIAQIGYGYTECSSGLDLLCFYLTDYVGKLWLCNPITKRTLTLPDLSDFAGRACLGYVSSTNEYKTVASFEGSLPGSAWVPYAYFEEFLHFKILTLKLDDESSVVGSWRGLLSRTQYYGTYHQPIHINGFIYWLAFAKDHMTILEMNLENEEVKILCCPNGYSFGFSHLTEINGYLCFVQNNTDGHMLDIWMLKGHEIEAWCLAYSVEVHESAYNFTILGYLPRNNENTGDILIKSFRGDLFCYETDTKKFKELQSLKRVEYKWCAFFYDSFFSVGMPENIFGPAFRDV